MTDVVERWLPLPDWRLVATAGFVLLGIGLGYQTTVGPALVIAALVGLAIVTVSFVSLPLGLAILTFLTFFELVPGFGSGNLTLVKLVGLLITFSWLARVIDTRSGIRLLFVEHRLFAVLLATFFVWAAASVGWAQNADAVTGTATRLLFVIILTFVAFSAVQEPKHLRWVLWAYCTGAFLTTVYGLANGLAVGRDERLTGGILNPNELAAALAPAVILGVVMIAVTRNPLWRTVLVVEVATCVVGLLLAQSRGAFIGIAVALVAAIFIAGPARPAAIVLVLVCIGAASVYYTGFTTQQQRQRLVNISERGSSGRSDEWRIAIAEAKDYPLLGVGLANFPIVEPRYLARSISLIRADRVLYFPPPHNMYLQVLSELGVIGLALFLTVLGSALAIGLKAIAGLARGPDRGTEIFARGLVISFIAVLTLNVFNNGLVEKGLWLFVGLLCAVASFVRTPTVEAQPELRAADDGVVLPI